MLKGDYETNHLATFQSCVSPKSWNDLKKVKLGWLAFALRFSVWLIIFELLVTVLLFLFHTPMALGIGMSSLILVTSVLTAINFLALLVVSPRSLPFYVRLKRWLYQKHFAKRNDEHYQVKVDADRCHDVERGYFKIDAFECPVAWLKSRHEGCHRWILFIPGAGSLPGDYTDVRRSVYEVNHLFGDHHHILVINRPKSSFLQRAMGFYCHQVPLNTVKSAFQFIKHQGGEHITWYGHCMGAAMMVEAFKQIQREQPYLSIKHQMVLDRTFSSVARLLMGIPLLSWVIRLSGFNYRITPSDLPKRTMIIHGSKDVVIPPFAELTSEAHQSLSLPVGHLDALFRLNPEETLPLIQFLDWH